MSRSRRGFAAPIALSSAARLGVIGLTLLSAGCASKHAAYEPPARVAGPAHPSSQAAWAAKVEIEDDGLPAQLAPRHRPATPDEPSEPWSPNYGQGKARSAAAKPSAADAAHRPAVASERIAPSTRVSGIDEDALIRRAIAEHEMRRRD